MSHAEVAEEAVPPSEAPPASEAPSDLRAPELYANRELSWLDFNERVLELAEDERLPLLERVRFLAIYTSNLDEFFMVRVAGLHDQVDAGIDARGPDGLSPSEAIDGIAARARELGERHVREYERLRPELACRGIRLVACDECDEAELRAIEAYFREQLFPVLTPLAIGLGRPFPYISNLSLSLAVRLRDPADGHELMARVKVPREALPRFVPIGGGAFVTLEDIIARHLGELFPGVEILGHDVFRVTRDADFTVSDEADDLVRAVEDELRQRRFGEVVRLQVGAGMDAELRARLVEALGVEEREVYDREGVLDLSDLTQIADLEGHSELRWEPWTPVVPAALATETGPIDVLGAMRTGDLLVHHPYDSFAASVERLARQAVEDPDVLAVKLTVYRTSDGSSLIPSLVEAAEAGKQAVCMVELKARFDERRNIGWTKALEQVGAHVVHGPPALKTHAKALLVVRREGSGVRHYVHVGTGNYHAKTARLYEDLGLFTTDPAIAADVAELFNSLTGYGRPARQRRVLVAPERMRDGLIEEIERTVTAKEDGQAARIVMKMNALVDERCIEALYAASRAGVPIDLNVRGVCCLRPGMPGVSETIRVVSVVGRFLEHARIFAFLRDEAWTYYIGSADLMPRNLDHRVELLAPVDAPELQARLGDVLERCLADDTFAWDLEAAGRWTRRTRRTRAAHRDLMERAAAAARPGG